MTGPLTIHTHSDIIEEIIAEEIVDETDRYEDNQSKRRAKRMTTAAVMRGCVVCSRLSSFFVGITSRFFVDRIVERERRLDAAASPHVGERTPLLGVSPGILEVGDMGSKGLIYGNVRSDSPRP